VLVTDPSFNAVQVAGHLAHLAKELGIPHIHLVINRVRSEDDVRKVCEILGRSMDLFAGVHVLPYDEGLIRCEPDVRRLLGTGSPFIDRLRALQRTLVRFGK
jgi:CO dehydrogenase maturation factor